MKTINATSARSNFFNLIKETIRGHKEIRIMSKEGSAVLLSEEEYDTLLETLHLLSEPGLKESIKEADKDIEEGDTYSIDEVF